MAGLTSSLMIGLSGLKTHQEALNVIGHNISNASTPGYSRQKATITSANSQNLGNFVFGAGSNLSNIQAVRDRFLNLQIASALTKQAGAETRFASLEAISPVFSEGGDASLGALVQKFFQGFQDLAARPEDQSVRTALLGQANSMVGGIQSRYTMLREQRASADASVESIVTEVNTLTARIAELNLRISHEPTPGADNDARDQRNELVNQLSTLVGIQTFEDSNSLLTVVVDGAPAPLVAGTVSFDLTATKDPANNNYFKVEVQLGSPIDVTTLRGGNLGAKLDMRDTVLPGIQQRLDQLAAGIQGQVNLVHRAGFALDGATTGLDFFMTGVANGADGLPVTVSAATNYQGMVNAWSVNAAIMAAPSLIGAAAAAGSVGDNTQAKAIANLQFQNNTVDTNGDAVGDSGPFSTYIGIIIGGLGSQTRGYQTENTTEQNLLQALQNQRDRISGVSLDEEAADLMTMQRGYQASARFISVIDQLTEQLVNNFGR